MSSALKMWSLTPAHHFPWLNAVPDLQHFLNTAKEESLCWVTPRCGNHGSVKASAEPYKVLIRIFCFKSVLLLSVSWFRNSPIESSGNKSQTRWAFSFQCCLTQLLVSFSIVWKLSLDTCSTYSSFCSSRKNILFIVGCNLNDNIVMQSFFWFSLCSPVQKFLQEFQILLCLIFCFCSSSMFTKRDELYKDYHRVIKWLICSDVLSFNLKLCSFVPGLHQPGLRRAKQECLPLFCPLPQ